MRYISILITGRYGLYNSLPEIFALIVDSEDFEDDIEKSVLHSDTIVIRDKRKVMSNSQHTELLKIAEDFNFDAATPGAETDELAILLRKVR